MTLSPMLRVLLAAGSLFTASHTIADPVKNADRQESLRQGEVRQRLIRGQAAELASQWDAMVEEYSRNGLLNGADAGMVKDLHSLMANLTEKEMREVVDLLQKSRELPDPSASRQALAAAWSDQKAIVGTMRQILTRFDHARLQSDLVPADRVAEMRSAEQKVEDLVNAQKAIIADTSALPPVSVTSQPPQANSRRNAAASGIRKQVLDTAERNKQLAGDLAGTEASEALKAAAPGIQVEQSALNPDAILDVPKAMAAETGALAQMEAAQAALQRDLAKAEASVRPAAQAMEAAPADRLATLRDLQRQGEALAAQQAPLTTQTPGDPASTAREQEAARKRAEELSQRAAAVVPQAAKALGEAATKMKEAETQLVPESRALLAKGAADDVAAANHLIAEELAAATRAAKALDAAPRIAAAISALADAEQNVENQTLQAGASPSASALRTLLSEQQQIIKEAGAFARTNQPAPATVLAVAQAVRDMRAASHALAVAKPDAADGKEQSAVEDLHKAEQSLAQNTADAKKALGLATDGPASDLSEAAHALERAQARIANAANSMKGGSKDSSSAARQLSNAAADVQAAQASSPSANVQGLLGEARRALASAANQATDSSPSGMANATEASRAISRAQALLGQAQAGIQPSAARTSKAGAAPSTGAPAPAQEGASQPARSQPATVASSSSSGAASDHQGGALQRGNRPEGPPTGQYLGLPERDREVIQQSRAEKYPEEYGQMVEQYMRNLSDHPR